MLGGCWLQKRRRRPLPAAAGKSVHAQARRRSDAADGGAARLGGKKETVLTLTPRCRSPYSLYKLNAMGQAWFQSNWQPRRGEEEQV